MLELFDKVTIEDSSGNSITYKANKQEINGFGLVLDDQKYDYVLKVNEDNEWKFLIRKVQGGRFSVYYSFYFANGYGGGASYRTDIFMIEDSSQKTVTVEGGIFSSYKKKIRRFLNNDKNLIDLFDKRVLNITDIPRFIKEANAVK
ncbi:MAG TPA: hypothetical protein VKT28_19410 [Puia sp.]|nr:hypothetical protein [Puia sp.]